MAEEKIIPKKTKPGILTQEHNRMPTSREDEDFSKMHTGQVTSAFMQTKGKADPIQLDLYGNAEITQGDFTLRIENYNSLVRGIPETARILFDALVIKFTGSTKDSGLVALHLKEYLEMRNRKDTVHNRKEIRKQVQEDLRALDSIRFDWKEKRRGTPGSYLKVRISGGTEGIVNGVILFRFNPDFIPILKNYAVMPFPNKLLSVNTQYNPYTRPLFRKITEHKNMNHGKKNEDIISVKALLGACPDMPKYEDIKETGHINRRIIDPFNRDMDVIEDFTWEYCGRNGAPLEDPDPEKDYHTWINTNVRVFWKNYPKRPPAKKKKKKPAKGNQPPRIKHKIGGVSII